MDTLKERIIDTISTMNQAQMETVWHFVLSVKEGNRRSWDDIPEVEPDEWDLEMLERIENDPECHEFISSEELKKSLGML